MAAARELAAVASRAGKRSAPPRRGRAEAAKPRRPQQDKFVGAEEAPMVRQVAEVDAEVPAPEPEKTDEPEASLAAAPKLRGIQLFGIPSVRVIPAAGRLAEGDSQWQR